jgi:hypothetical protein
LDRQNAFGVQAFSKQPLNYHTDYRIADLDAATTGKGSQFYGENIRRNIEVAGPLLEIQVLAMSKD